MKSLILLLSLIMLGGCATGPAINSDQLDQSLAYVKRLYRKTSWRYFELCSVDYIDEGGRKNGARLASIGGETYAIIPAGPHVVCIDVTLPADNAFQPVSTKQVIVHAKLEGGKIYRIDLQRFGDLNFFMIWISDTESNQPVSERVGFSMTHRGFIP
jgi:hypothetical protein